MKLPNLVVIPPQVMMDRRLTLIETRILIAVFSFRNAETNICWPSRARIEERTGYSGPRISNAMSSLVEKGWIERTQRRGPNLYRTKVPELDTVPDPVTVSETGTDTLPESGTPEHTKNIPKEMAPTVPSENEVSTPKTNGCPYQKILDLYHERLPMLPRVKMLTGNRKNHMRMRWQNELPDLETWGLFFNDVAKSKFLTGQAEPRAGRRPFQADIDFLLKPSNIAKISEGKYHG